MKYLSKFESIRGEYEIHGVDKYYQTHGNQYKNPHQDKLQNAMDWVINNWNIDYTNVLDLSCGGGEITKILVSNGYNNVEGSDPYTCSLYKDETGKPCKNISFDDIMKNGLDKHYSTIVCSYALHLADKTKLPQIIYQLSRSCNTFLLLGPTKNPVINDDWGMKLINSSVIKGIIVREFSTDF